MTKKIDSKLIFKPQFGNLLLKEVQGAESIGGIILPTNIRKPANQGIVIASGPDVPEGKGFDLGCVVVYPKFVDHEITVDRTAANLHVVNYNDVILSDFGYFATLQNDEK